MSKRIEEAAKEVFHGKKDTGEDGQSENRSRERRDKGERGDSGSAITMEELEFAERGIDRLVGNKKP